jgi:hypothetical protein
MFIKSCREVKINPNVLGHPGAIALPNITLKFAGQISDNPNAFRYKTVGSNTGVVIKCSADRTSCNAWMNTDGVTFMLEQCENNVHVWIRLLPMALPPEQPGLKTYVSGFKVKFYKQFLS